MLPNMARALNRFKLIPLEVKRITGTTIVNFKEVATYQSTFLDGVVQDASKEVLQTLNLDFSIKHKQIHLSTDDLNFNPEVKDIIIYKDKEYEIKDLGDYLDYGYYEAICEEIKNA